MKGMQESQTEKEDMRQQQRMKVMKDMTRKIKSKGSMDANSSWSVSELLAADCRKAYKLVSRMIRSAGGGTAVAQNHQTNGVERRQILKEEEEDAKRLARCDQKKKERAKHWQCAAKVED